jgi:hypothetical protein
MYRCHRCGEVAPPGAPSIEVVLESRARRYPARRYFVRGQKKERIDPGGEGTETARAARVCRGCAGVMAPE